MVVVVGLVVVVVVVVVGAVVVELVVEFAGGGGVGGVGGGGGVGGTGGGGTTAMILAQVLVVAAEFTSWALCCVVTALCIDMLRVSAITLLSMAIACESLLPVSSFCRSAIAFIMGWLFILQF